MPPYVLGEIMITLKTKLLAMLIYVLFFVFSGCPFLFKVLVGAAVFFLLLQATWTKHDKLQIYFGVPGSGKTTFAAWYAKQAARQGIKCLSNVPIKGTYIMERADIGKYHISNCLMLVDEGSLEYNNRDFKSFKLQENKWWSLHRHYKVEPIILSQGASDVDKRLRTLSQCLYHVQRSVIPYFIVRKEIRKIVDIDGMSHDIVDGYEFRRFSARYIFAPALWQMFDSFDAPRLPDKPGGWHEWYGTVSSSELASDADDNILNLMINLPE